MPRRGPDHDPNDPAPALTRGLRIIRSLAQDGPSLLEHLARRERWPKSSTFRLLAALERAGVAARDPLTRRWHARMQFEAAAGVDSPERARMRSLLVDLAQASGYTAEAYGFRPEHMVLIERAEPENGEAVVRARIGFIRQWAEVDAVTQIAFAFGFTQPPLTTHHWCIDRARSQATHDEITGLLAQVRERACAADRGLNDNGVRRFAAPVRNPQGELLGAIAIAQSGGVPVGRDDDRLLELVKATVLRV